MDIISSSGVYSISEISNLQEEDEDDSSTIPSITSPSSILSLSILNSPVKNKSTINHSDIIDSKDDIHEDNNISSIAKNIKMKLTNSKSRSSSSSLNHYIIPLRKVHLP